MTDKILSQDEVDALLKGVATGEIETEESPEKVVAGARSYDFTSQERIIRGRMPGLEMANDAFARKYRHSLSNLISKFVDISIQNVEIVKFGDFIRTIPVPSSINIFKMSPLKGYALLVLEAPLVFALIEFFFGGSSAHNIKSEGRAFTSIENRVINKFVQMALEDIAEAWKGIAPVRTEFIGTEINPQFVTIVTTTEIVINIEILIEIEDFAGRMFICIPYSMVEPVKDKLHSGIQGDRQEADHRWAEMLRAALKETSVELSVEVDTLTLTFGDVINFQPGNIIKLGKTLDQEVTLMVEGRPKFRGLVGVSHGSQAVKITRIVE
jgi:flagellar motor switch protein FliM